MGCDWYDFNAFATSGNAIAVFLKDVKEVHKPGSSKATDDALNDNLESDEIAWLLDQAKGFKVFNLGYSLILFMKEHEKIIECPSVDVPGPYEIEREYMSADMHIEKAPEGDDFNVLFELARKLTPQDKKLSFAPGWYSFSMTSSYLMGVKELKGVQKPDAFSFYRKTMRDEFKRKRPNSTFGKYIKQAFENLTPEEKARWEARAQEEENQSQETPPTGSDAPIPLDFDIVVGEGDDQKTVKTNKAVLATFLPKFESLLEDVDKTKTLVLPDLDQDAVGTVLDAFTSRKFCEFPRWGDEQKVFQKVGKRFGVDPYYKENYEPKEKKAKTDDLDHPAFNNPRWSDVTFIVGPTNEEIKANRAVLASLNPVLCRILYGTGSIPVDPSQPIRWPDFDVLAVKKVLLAMVQLGKKEVVVPIDSVPSAKALVDYLLETSSELNLYYETPFAREFEYGAKFNSAEDGEGLVLA